jgi:hypothetical protein
MLRQTKGDFGTVRGNGGKGENDRLKTAVAAGDIHPSFIFGPARYCRLELIVDAMPAILPLL